MITEITNNPFRILGLPANAKRDEIDQCYQFLMEGMQQQSSDALYVKEIEDAYNAVTSSEFHWHHALFWFVRLSARDEHAIQLVEEENYEAAANIWEETVSFASSHNLMLCYMLMGESTIEYYAKAFSHARDFFIIESDFNAFFESVSESKKDAETEAEGFLDIVFSQTSADKATLYALLGNKTWMEYVRGKWVDAEEADAGAENMRNYINIAEHAREAEEAEKSRKSLFNRIWWLLLFPIYLYVHHQCQNSKPTNHIVPLEETIKTSQNHSQVIDMTDSATFNRVNTEIKNMRDTSAGEHKSLREKVKKKRERLREKQD